MNAPVLLCDTDSGLVRHFIDTQFSTRHDVKVFDIEEYRCDTADQIINEFGDHVTATTVVRRYADGNASDDEKQRIEGIFMRAFIARVSRLNINPERITGVLYPEGTFDQPPFGGIFRAWLIANKISIYRG